MHNNGSHFVSKTVTTTPTQDWSHLTEDDRALLDKHYATGHGCSNDADLALLLSKFAGGYSIDEFIADLRADDDEDEDDDENVDAADKTQG